MANYVDGFVLPVPRKKLGAYRRMAVKSGKIWMEHGALAYCEAVADDVKPGKHTSFPQSVKLKKGEVVIFSYAVYKSRKDRDRVIARPWSTSKDHAKVAKFPSGPLNDFLVESCPRAIASFRHQ